MGYILFSRSTGTVDQDWHVGGSYQADIVIELFGSITFSFQIGMRFLFGFRAFLREGSFGKRSFFLLKCFAHFLKQLFGINGFGNIVLCTQFHCLYGWLDICISCHDNQWDMELFLTHPFQQVNTIVVGKSQVGKNQVYRLCIDVLLRTCNVTHWWYIKPFFA